MKEYLKSILSIAAFLSNVHMYMYMHHVTSGHTHQKGLFPEVFKVCLHEVGRVCLDLSIQHVSIPGMLIQLAIHGLVRKRREQREEKECER